MSRRICLPFFNGLCPSGDKCEKSHDMPTFDKTAETVLLSKIEIELKLVKQQKNLLSRLLIMKCEQNLDVDYQEIIDTNFKCSICFEIFVKPTALNCAHVFCEWCIHNWLKSTVRCPICRKCTAFRSYCREYDNYVKKMVQNAGLEVQTFHSLLEEKRAKMRANSDLSTLDVNTVEEASEYIRKLKLNKRSHEV